MPSKQVLPLLLMALVTGACSSSKSAERAEPPPPPPILFKSPLALLLEHHEELRLSTDQMIAVGRLDSELREKNKPLRMRLRELRPQGPERPPPSRGPGMDTPPPGVDPRSWGTGRRRSPFAGMGGPRPPEAPPETEEARKQRLEQVQALLEQMENNEAAAYAEAEKVLDEKQQARARELVTQQREARQKAREAMRAPRPESESQPEPESEPAPEG